MRPARRSQPFDHPDWLYEIKFDGFRALAYFEAGRCRLVSRRRHEYKSFHELCASIANHLRGNEAVLDGEIVCRSVRTVAVLRTDVRGPKLEAAKSVAAWLAPPSEPGPAQRRRPNPSEADVA